MATQDMAAVVALFVLFPALLVAVILTLLAEDDAAPGVGLTDDIDHLLRAKRRWVLRPLQFPAVGQNRASGPPAAEGSPDVLGALVAAKHRR